MKNVTKIYKFSIYFLFKTPFCKSFIRVQDPDTCGHVCPGLAACIRPDLVCDGVTNCPGGGDEVRY